jgi:tetratricopeptide (TPR) repeat protein
LSYRSGLSEGTQVDESKIQLASNYIDYANSRVKLGQFEAALESYVRAIVIHPTAEALQALAQFEEMVTSYYRAGTHALNIYSAHYSAQK